MTLHRSILHVDMDAFYASIEQEDNPGLKGREVIVGGTGPRGVVAAASYEVRRFGVHSAMPMKQALKRCPHAICVRPRFDRYADISKRIFRIFESFTPLVEGLSLDEAFLDVTESLALFDDVAAIGWSIKKRIKEETGLTASVGIGPNKLVAKIASDLDKPDGLCHVAPEQVEQVLDPLPIQKLSGIGPKTARQLHRRGVRTFLDLRTAPDRTLEPVFGRFTAHIRERAAGVDDRPVIPDQPEKSISAEETFDEDISDLALLKAHLVTLADRTAARLRAKGLMAGQVRIKVRRADFRTATRQCSMHPPGNQTQHVIALAARLLREWLMANPGAALRLIGVGVSQISPARQMALFDDEPRASTRCVDETVDSIRRRFGDGSVRRGRALK